MANKKQMIVLKWDKPRELKYGMNALAKLEKMIGKPLSQMNTTNMGIYEMRDMLYCGLYHEDKDLTLEKVGDLVDEYADDMADLGKKLNEAIQASLDGKK